MTDVATTTTRTPKRQFAEVELETPLRRGDSEIVKVRLRRPTAGDYRGTTMSAAYAMDPIALGKVISRVSDPMISEAEYLTMDSDDAAELGGEIVDFLLTARKKEKAGLTE